MDEFGDKSPQSGGCPAAGAILTLLGRRTAGSSICPSEAARALAGAEWRGAMDRVHAAADRLAAAGAVERTRRGTALGPGTVRGAYRLRLPVRAT